jgi:hypothetical protein
VKISDGDDRSLTMVPQFYIFWAVSVPVTLLVLILWILWSQRVEVAKFISDWQESSRQKSDDGKDNHQATSDIQLQQLQATRQ